jgi:subtilisin-like proprotein convertase family protein
MGMQAIGRWLGEAKKVALLLLAAGLAAVAALGLASAASAATFSNTDGPITINNPAEDCVDVPGESPTGQATPYPSAITVGGLTGSVTDVNVTVSGLSHTFPDDVGLLLVSPEGKSAILMTDSGGSHDVSDITLVFDDDASGGLLDEPASQIESGTYDPSVGTVSDCLAPESFPTDATGTNPPAGPYGSSLSVFNGSDPNGIWKLYVIDDFIFDAGSITGWSLDISTTTADTTPPTVTTTIPEDGALGVSRTTTVKANFSEPVQNVSPETFILERKIAVKKSPPKFVRVDATVTPSDDGLSAELTPVQDLPKGEYRVTITTEVTDLADNALDQDSAQAENQPMVWTFTVAN